MKRFSLDTPFKLHGGFWLAADPSAVAEGQLVYEPKEVLNLVLARHFPIAGQRPWARAATAGERMTIFGQLVNGQLVTLNNAFVSKSGFGMGFPGPVEITVNECFVGAHISSLDSRAVTAISIGCTSLESWFSRSPFSDKLVTKGKRRLGLDFTYRYPEPFSINVPKLSACFKMDFVLNHNFGISSGTLEHRAYWKIVPRRPITFKRARTVAWHAHNLLTLLVGSPTEVRDFVCKVEPGPLVSMRDVDRDRKVRAIYLQRVKAKDKEIFAPEMILPYSQCAKEFPKIARRWFNIAETAKQALNVLFGTIYQPPPVLELTFLSMTQAIESYDRCYGTSTYMDQTAYDQTIAAVTSRIPTAIAGDHRHSLLNRLKYGNEYSMRKRLSRMLASLPKAVAVKISGSNDFVQRVVATRNYFTHYGEDSKSDAYRGSDILYAAERLRILLTVKVLSDLGLKASTLSTILDRHRETAYYLSRSLVNTARSNDPDPDD
jgi:hypothetical protein